MRENATTTAWVLALFVLLLAPGEAPAAGPEPDDGIEVYFRNANLNALSRQDLEIYLDAEPGESSKLDRAFPGAPPQISHTVEDMLPISSDDNECMDCHHPDNVTSKEEMPIPESHFQTAVMGPGAKGEGMLWKVKGYKKGSEVSGARFECIMCHTPQATNVKTPASRFVREKTEPGTK